MSFVILCLVGAAVGGQKMPRRLISSGGSNNKTQIGCHIDQLRQYVNVNYFRQMPTGAAGYLPHSDLCPPGPLQNSCGIEP